MKQWAKTEYLLALFAGLKDSGVRRAVISPGSRSTPLALVAYRDPDVECFVDVDERSAAFFALGMAKVTHDPVVLICTSGTAAANYFPAVCEAQAARVPLVILTADRPPELHRVGAAQTMDQDNLYGSHVKQAISLAVADDSEQMIQYAYWNARQISARAVESPSGPVQINVPLRDPLLPDPEATLPALSRVRTPGTQSWDAQGVDGGDIFHDISGKRGVVVIGGMLDVADAQAWVAAAQRLGWPIIGDPATNVPVAAAGTGLGGARAEILFTALYQHESEASQALLDALEPDVILRVGRLPVSKSVVRWMKQSHAAMILIDNAGLREDETMSARILIDAHASGVRAWGEALAHAAHVQLSAAPPTWQAVWQRMDTLVNDVLAHSSLVNTLHHSSASVALTESVREGSNIVLANSNAIRHVDRYAPRRAGITYMANRGLNGIDGMISTACGVACTRPDVPTYFLTGDLGFFHDMNGLEVAARYHLPLTVVVLNNNGGGIFAFLQQARLNDDEFGALFQTPLTMDIRSVASVYRAEYSHPTTLDELRHALRHNTREQGLRIVEVSSTISDDVHVMQTVCADIALACTRLIHDHATHPDCQVKE